MSDLLDRFWRSVEKTPTCWLWKGGQDGKGYGRFRVGGLPYGGRALYAHRWIYEQMVGPFDEDLTIDHLCMVRNCVNPEHLEPVTLAENARRGRLASLGRTA